MKSIAKFTYTIAAAIAAAILIISFVGGGALKVRAATSALAVQEFESRSVSEDLTGAVVDGKEFDKKNYPGDDEGQPEIISFAEYAFGYYNDKRGDYGLYVYLYNPRGVKTELKSQQNKIQLSFGTSSDAEPFKYPLKYLNDEQGLIIKYRVDFTQSEKAACIAALNVNERVYNVSGVELLTAGEYTATDYAVKTRYTYTGFAEGYGSTEGGEELSCREDGIKTVSLDVEHTYYRTKTSQLGANHQVQLDTVYFSVPKSLIDEYGSLQRIKAEWYEYETKPMLITNRKDVSERLQPYIGEHIGESYDEGAYYGFATTNILANQTEFDSDTFMYNYCVYRNKVIKKTDLYTIYEGGYSLFNCPNVEALYYLFYTDKERIMEYDPFGDVTDQAGIKSSRVYDYIKETSKLHSGGERLPIKDGRIWAEMFEDDIAEDRKTDNARGKIQKGYSYYDFDIDEDFQTIGTYQPGDHSFTENVNMYGFWNALLHKYDDVESWRSLPPIQILKDSDLAGTSDEAKKSISSRLCVNYNDIGALQDYYKNATNGGENVVVLFRFATTDYYSAAADITQNKMPTPAADNAIDDCAYMAKGTCFFDFDIIRLSFNKKNVIHNIPVVMSPQDYITEITPPSTLPEKPGINIGIKLPLLTKKSAGLPVWSWLLIAAIAAVVIVILIIFCPGVFTFAFRAVWKFIRSITAKIKEASAERNKRKTREKREKSARKSQMKMQRFQYNLNRREYQYQSKLNEKDKRKEAKKARKRKTKKGKGKRK